MYQAKPRPQFKGPVWHGKPKPAKTRGYHRANDDVLDDDIHPDDIKSVTAKVRGKVVLSDTFHGKIGQALGQLSVEHGRKLYVRVRLKCGGWVKYRGNGKKKGELRK